MLKISHIHDQKINVGRNAPPYELQETGPELPSKVQIVLCAISGIMQIVAYVENPRVDCSRGLSISTKVQQDEHLTNLSP